MTLLTVPAAERVKAPRWLPLAAVGLAAAAMLAILPTNPDVSWGLTMAEKWLDGGRLYIDIVEVNPPATMYLYVVPVWVARQIGVAPELTTSAFVLLAVALSLWIAARIVHAAKLTSAQQAWPLLAIAAAVLTLLPGRSFAEREQIALIALMPLLAVNWVRAVRLTPSWRMALIAGIGAGITSIIKPYFAAAVLCSGLAAAVSARSWRVLFALENCVAAAVLAGYFVFVWRAYPVYVTEMMPLLAAVYVPLKEPLGTLLIHEAMPLWVLMLLLLWMLLRTDLLKPPLSLLLAASAGFAVAYVVQQKGWLNHAFPMLALALLALAYATFMTERHKRGSVLATLLIAGIACFWMIRAEDRSALAAPIRAVAPHARVLAISPHLTVGHPAVREAGGVWVSRVSALWITQGVLMIRAQGHLEPGLAARLDAYAERDRRMLIEDIVNNRPDVILAQREPEIDWLAWARSDPVLAAELNGYALAGTLDDIAVLRRKGEK